MLMGSEREEHHFVMVREKSISQIKSDLIHAFLCTPDLSHSVASPTSFRAEYRRAGSVSMFSRNVKFQVDIASTHSDTAGDKMHCVTFTLVAGPVRRFKRLCELIQSMIMSPNHVMSVGHRISTDLSSDASSTSYSSMDRVSPTPDEVFQVTEQLNLRYGPQISVNGRKTPVHMDGSRDTKL